VNAFHIAVQRFDAAVQERTDREDSFSLRVDQMLRCPAWDKAEHFIDECVTPSKNLIAESSFFFSRFLTHGQLLTTSLL